MSNLRRQMLQMISKYLALLTLGGPGLCHAAHNTLTIRTRTWVWCEPGMLNGTGGYKLQPDQLLSFGDPMTDWCWSLNIIWLVVPAVVNQFIIAVVNETLWAMLGKIICRPLWWLTTSERWVICPCHNTRSQTWHHMTDAIKIYQTLFHSCELQCVRWQRDEGMRLLTGLF